MQSFNLPKDSFQDIGFDAPTTPIQPASTPLPPIQQTSHSFVQSTPVLSQTIPTTPSTLIGLQTEQQQTLAEQKKAAQSLASQQLSAATSIDPRDEIGTLQLYFALRQVAYLKGMLTNEKAPLTLDIVWELSKEAGVDFRPTIIKAKTALNKLQQAFRDIDPIGSGSYLIREPALPSVTAPVAAPISLTTSTLPSLSNHPSSLHNGKNGKKRTLPLPLVPTLQSHNKRR